MIQVIVTKSNFVVPPQKGYGELSNTGEYETFSVK